MEVFKLFLIFSQQFPIIRRSYFWFLRRVVDVCSDVSEEPTASIFRATIWLWWMLKLLERKV